MTFRVRMSLYNMMIVAGLLLSVVMASPANALPFFPKRECSALFKPSLVEEFRAVGPGRIFFRPNAERPVAQAMGFLTEPARYYENDGRVFRALKKSWQFMPRRVIGLVRGENGRLHDLIYGDPRYVLTPASGVQHLLDATTYSMSRILNLKRRYVASMVLSLFVHGGVGVGTWSYVVDPYLAARNEAIVSEALEKRTQADRAELIRSIRYDVRDQDLRDLWRSTIPTAKSAAERKTFEDSILEMAELRKVSNRTFFENFEIEKFSASRESVGDLVTYPQFEHLQERFNKDAGREFDTKVWTGVVYLNWTYQLMNELAPQFVTDGPALKEALRSPAIRDAYGKIYSGDFMLSVRELYRQKRLSRDEAAGLVGRALYYRTRIAESRLLNGTAPASISDIERELLATAISGRDQWEIP